MKRSCANRTERQLQQQLESAMREGDLLDETLGCLPADPARKPVILPTAEPTV
ncbi:hypothetical protein KCP71_00030 [Salmonella enterica subsp. enterica]|nr:hypothetical protein KCP71_00030 [Salmonella enterica subsp. enterica]